MTSDPHSTNRPASFLPPDDPTRNLVIAQSDDPDSRHIGLVGDTYTILLTGPETAGRFCLMDMHIPPGGGPPPHRHDFEESFIILEGDYFSRQQIDRSCGPDRSHSGERAAPVSKLE
jgi:hypothetical protein